MIDLFLRHAPDPKQDTQLIRELAVHQSTLLASAGKGDPDDVVRSENAVIADPGGSFALDAAGHATLAVEGRTWAAGRFETPTLRELRRWATRTGGGQVRLWVLDGMSPSADVGGLQATAGDGQLFQVASQFNCLESTGAHVTRVTNYFSDHTQGPRASISAFPGTLLRHYFAPAPDGSHYVQSTGGKQINLLADVLDPSFARVQSGYLSSELISDPTVLEAALEGKFDLIRVGVHDGLQVALGFDWEGAGAAPERRIGQVFTSTIAGGGYGSINGPLLEACRHLLRAAYLGTLLSALALERPRVVLTLIGGGVFGNPPALIWEAILWALAEVEPLTTGILDVIVNGYNIGRLLPREEILSAVRAHEGALLTFGPGGAASIVR
jgi:hypothetical protein